MSMTDTANACPARGGEHRGVTDVLFSRPPQPADQPKAQHDHGHVPISSRSRVYHPSQIARRPPHATRLSLVATIWSASHRVAFRRASFWTPRAKRLGTRYRDVPSHLALRSYSALPAGPCPNDAATASAVRHGLLAEGTHHRPLGLPAHELRQRARASSYPQNAIHLVAKRSISHAES